MHLSSAQVFDLFSLDSNPLHLLALMRLMFTDDYVSFNFHFTDRKEVEIMTHYTNKPNQCHMFTGIVLAKTTPSAFLLEKRNGQFSLTEPNAPFDPYRQQPTEVESVTTQSGLVLNWNELDSLFDLGSTETFPGLGLLPKRVLDTNGFIRAQLIDTTEPVLKLTTSASSGVKVRHLGLEKDQPVHNSTAIILKTLMPAAQVMFITACGKDQYLVEGISYVGLGRYIKNHLTFLLKEYP